MGLFQRSRRPTPAVIGVVHLLPLPGSPRWKGSLAQVLDRAELEASIYREAGLCAIIVENMHDVPYLRGRVLPETTAAMAIAASRVKHVAGEMPVGVQLLAGANREALGVAVAAGLDFVRVEGYAYAHVADEGTIEACAGELLRARAALAGDDIEILADIKKKHASHALTSDLGIEEVAAGTEFCRADGLIVTGTTTGDAPDPAEIAAVRRASILPVLVGSGVTMRNAGDYLDADGLIVGSCFKQDGHWAQAVVPAKVRALVDAVHGRSGRPSRGS